MKRKKIVVEDLENKAKELLKLQKKIKGLEKKVVSLKTDLTIDMYAGQKVVVNGKTLEKIRKETPIFSDIGKVKRLLGRKFNKVVTVSIASMKEIKDEKWIKKHADSWKKVDYIKWVS